MKVFVETMERILESWQVGLIFFNVVVLWEPGFKMAIYFFFINVSSKNMSSWLKNLSIFK